MHLALCETNYYENISIKPQCVHIYLKVSEITRSNAFKKTVFQKLINYF